VPVELSIKPCASSRESPDALAHARSQLAAASPKTPMHPSCVQRSAKRVRRGFRERPATSPFKTLVRFVAKKRGGLG